MKIDKIANLNTSLRPSEIKPEIYYKIVELLLRNDKMVFLYVN